MAGKRIHGLDPISTPPTGAVLPVDAEGLPAALKITPKDLVDAASYILTPVLSDDPSPTTPEANRQSLEAELAKYAASGNRRGTMRMPKGVFEVDYTVTLTCAHSGLTIEGNDCVLFRRTQASPPARPENSVLNINLSTDLDPMGRGDSITPLGGNQFTLDVTPARYANYQKGDAIILYKSTNPGGGRQPTQQVAVILDKSTDDPQTITVDANLMAGVNLATYLFNGRKLNTLGVDLPAGATVIRIPPPFDAAVFPKQSWIYITDGVGELETTGEFVQVKSTVEAGGILSVKLVSALRNSYLFNRAAVVPSSPNPATGLRSRWAEDITIRGLTFGGSRAVSNNADLAPKFCVNLTLDRVRCVLTTTDPNVSSNGIIITTSGNVVLRECEATEYGVGLTLNTTRGVVVEKCSVTTSLDEFCSDVTFRDSVITHSYNLLFGTTRVNAINCRFANIFQFTVGDDCGLYGCDFVGTVTDGAGSLGIGGDRFTVRDVVAVAGPMRLLFLSGTGHHVGRVRGNDPDEPVVTVVAGSSGRIDGPIIGGTVTAEGGGSIPIPGSWMYPTDVQVPLTFPADAPTSLQVIGKLSGLRSEMWLRVTLVASGYGVSITRIYEIARSYQFPAQWYLCQPQSERRREYDLVNRTVFDLELHEGEVDA